jgi:hypothetical protein
VPDIGRGVIVDGAVGGSSAIPTFCSKCVQVIPIGSAYVIIGHDVLSQWLPSAYYHLNCAPELSRSSKMITVIVDGESLTTQLIARLRLALEARPKWLAVPIDVEDVRAVLAVLEGAE